MSKRYWLDATLRLIAFCFSFGSGMAIGIMIREDDIESPGFLLAFAAAIGVVLTGVRFNFDWWLGPLTEEEKRDDEENPTVRRAHRDHHSTQDHQ